MIRLKSTIKFLVPLLGYLLLTGISLPVYAQKIVTVYLLIDTPKQLQRYVNDLNRVKKANFNRVVFSFVRPTLPYYEQGNLANTGILGYFDQGDGKGAEAFNQLKTAVQLSKNKAIEPFLSVGGWNYSCNYSVYEHNCGAPGMNYDYFPDPTDPIEADLAQASYKNLITLAHDLGMEGIDFDYEEFWHADAYATSWAGQPWATELANQIIKAGGPSYDNLMKLATGTGSTYVMPKTVDKVAAILHLMTDNPAAANLHFASAAPPVGARPINSFVYGDNKEDIYTKGGLWWKGNLKGLWYSLTAKDKELVHRFDSLGLMTYDLCGDDAAICAPYGGGPLDLPGQVRAYMSDYLTWLKASDESEAKLSISTVGKVDFYPAKYHIPTKIQFGFEVNQPAYPKNLGGQLQLTDNLVNQILQQQKDSDGVIIWQMYSQTNPSVPGATTTRYTINQSCKTFLAHDARYDCDAPFPNLE
ncbi:glycosyl hydrolase family 18 protein [Legionella brunensis]|uniref:Glycosyl hydrolases family 18 n=1 Tax=Legionella brunensis TaxID=29422 RepID=A0A0W0S4G3_9GAMM|nr:glycosyl hydrolase family 18 protein [Legionella brunensis]KTC78355.1 Glycosyl hydrolases family 18 [Legionella brunensis]